MGCAKPGRDVRRSGTVSGRRAGIVRLRQHLFDTRSYETWPNLGFRRLCRVAEPSAWKASVTGSAWTGRDWPSASFHCAANLVNFDRTALTKSRFTSTRSFDQDRRLVRFSPCAFANQLNEQLLFSGESASAPKASVARAEMRTSGSHLKSRAPKTSVFVLCADRQ
jgi:hypothetical protein